MAKKISISGIIGLDVTSQNVKRKLRAAAGEPVLVEISSPGGLISEGLTMFNDLINYSGGVDTHLSGMVASMASYIAMAGESRTAEKNSVFNIHNGSGLAIGDHRDMFKAGKHLESLSNMVAKEYSEGSGIGLDEIRGLMDEDTFYYGDEIQEAGFVHEMIGAAEIGDRAEAVAAAQVMFQDCQTKINTPELIKSELKALSTMLAIKPTPKKPKQKEEAIIMNLAEMKEKHPELYAQIVAIGDHAGMEKGVIQERDRVKALTEMRASFPKPHSQKVIDTAITEGHDTATLSVNLMAADQAEAELEAGKKDKATPPGGGDGANVPEMVDGVMTHVEHLDNMGAAISKLPGVL